MSNTSSRLPLVEGIVESLTNQGMMDGPCALGMKKIPNQYGGYYTIHWSVPRWADGCIYFFNQKKITVRWQYARRPHDTQFNSIEELTEWIVTNGYTGSNM